jgi:hypothetical protein
MKIQWLLILVLLFASGCKKPAPTGGGASTANKPVPGGTSEVVSEKSPAPAIGDLAPEIEGSDLNDVAFKLSDYKGKVVVLDFWGDW